MLSHVCVAEFQNIIIPHPKFISFLDEAFKNSLRRPEAIDEIISAEISHSSDSVLSYLVLNHSIPNPCISNNPSAVCLKETSCNKKFPK